MSIKNKHKSGASNQNPASENKKAEILLHILPLATAAVSFLMAAGLILHVINMVEQDKVGSKLMVDFGEEKLTAPIKPEVEEIILKNDGSAETNAPEVSVDETVPVSYNYYDLKDQIPDADIFLRIDDTDISYPVMWSQEDGYYLNHAPDGSINRNGSIYLSSLNDPSLSDPINYIFGHNMRSGLMFRGLNYYLQSGYLESHKDCYIVTPEGTRHYTLFFAESTGSDTEFKVFNRDYIGQEEYISYIHNIANRTGVYLADDAELVVLITCTTSKRDNRTVVYGYLNK